MAWRCTSPPPPYALQDELSLLKALMGPTVSPASFQEQLFFLLLPSEQPATAYLQPKLMFLARNTEAASFWEKSRGNVSLLALKVELARVPRGYLSCCLLPGKLAQSSQSIPGIHPTPPKRPPASWARDAASAASACSQAGRPQRLCFLRSYGRSGKRCYCCQQQGASISGLPLEKKNREQGLT